MFWGQRAEDLAVLGREQESLDSGAQECRILRAVASGSPLIGGCSRSTSTARRSGSGGPSATATPAPVLARGHQHRELFRHDPSVRDDLALSEWSSPCATRSSVRRPRRSTDRPRPSSCAGPPTRRTPRAEGSCRCARGLGGTGCWPPIGPAEALAPRPRPPPSGARRPTARRPNARTAAFVWLNLGTARFQADGPEASLQAAQTAYLDLPRRGAARGDHGGRGGRCRLDRRRRARAPRARGGGRRAARRRRALVARGAPWTCPAPRWP